MLRAVQAGVASGAPDVRVDIQRRHLVISSQSSLGDVEDLLGWLTGLEPDFPELKPHGRGPSHGSVPLDSAVEYVDSRARGAASHDFTLSSAARRCPLGDSALLAKSGAYSTGPPSDDDRADLVYITPEEINGMVSRMLQTEPSERTVDLARLAILLQKAAEEMERQISSENS